MTERQEQAGDVGRPRTGRTKRAVTLTLSNEVTEYLDKLPAGERSKFADKAMKREIEREEQEMNNQTINSTVRYQGRLIGNVTIHPTGDTTGTAIIDGRTRKVVYRQATQGTRKGTMLWHCDDVD